MKHQIPAQLIATMVHAEITFVKMMNTSELAHKTAEQRHVEIIDAIHTKILLRAHPIAVLLPVETVFVN